MSPHPATIATPAVSRTRKSAGAPRTAVDVPLLVGASYRTAAATDLDRLSAACQPDAQLSEALARLVGPAVLLSTCNRTEVYLHAALPTRTARAEVLRLLAARTGLPGARLRRAVYVLSGVDACRHLMRVAAGLDSLVLGEPQIQGQVRAAWLRARAAADLGPILNELFRRAISGGRCIRAATGLTSHPSVATLAAQLVDDELGGARGRAVAVVGAGSTGKSVAWSLVQAGAQVLLVNRTAERAATTARALRLADPSAAVETWPLASLPQVLGRVEAAVLATSAPAPLVDVPAARSAVAARPGGPLLLVDISLPHNVAPDVRHVPGVWLTNLDDLARRCPAGLREQRETLAWAEQLAAAEAEAFGAWCAMRPVVPTIAALRSHANAIRAAELRRLAGRLSALSERDRRVVETLTAGIVNKLLHAPTLALREAGARGLATRYTRAVAELFALDGPPC